MTSQGIKSFPLEAEYKKPTGITPEDISKLRDWLRTQSHLPNDHITDLDLILCYHCCNNDFNLAKNLLDKHFTLKTQYTAFFKDRCFDEKMELTFNRVLFKIRTTDNGEAVLYGRLLDTDSKNFVMQDCMRAILMALELWQYEEGTCTGFVIVFDLDGFKFSHMFKMDFGLVQQFFNFLEEAMFVQIRGIHFLSVPSFWKYLMNILRKFVKSDLLDIVHIQHAGSSTLTEFLPIEHLPKEVGGTTKTLSECRDEMKTKMKNNNAYFLRENMKRVNEALRVVTPEATEVNSRHESKYVCY